MSTTNRLDWLEANTTVCGETRTVYTAFDPVTNTGYVIQAGYFGTRADGTPNWRIFVTATNHDTWKATVNDGQDGTFTSCMVWAEAHARRRARALLKQGRLDFLFDAATGTSK